jgi:hypothetical protein
VIAFRNVTRKRQTKFAEVIEWLDDKIRRLELSERERVTVERMKDVVTATTE